MGRTPAIALRTHLLLPEDVARVLDDGVHGVGDGEAVRPVVVRHAPVVLAHRQREADQAVLVEAAQAEQVLEHEHGVARLLEVVDVEHVEVEPADQRKNVILRM